MLFQLGGYICGHEDVWTVCAWRGLSVEMTSAQGAAVRVEGGFSPVVWVGGRGWCHLHPVGRDNPGTVRSPDREPQSLRPRALSTHCETQVCNVQLLDEEDIYFRVNLRDAESLGELTFRACNPGMHSVHLKFGVSRGLMLQDVRSKENPQA